LDILFDNRAGGAINITATGVVNVASTPVVVMCQREDETWDEMVEP